MYIVPAVYFSVISFTQQVDGVSVVIPIKSMLNTNKAQIHITYNTWQIIDIYTQGQRPIHGVDIVLYA